MDIEDAANAVPSNVSESARPCQPPTDHVLPGMDGVPISELNQTYTIRGLTSAQIQLLKKKYYTVFDNNELPHDKLFTAIFTCPLTGEHFASGELGGTGEDAVKVGDIYWYKSKKEAITAAAARTLDVFSLRRCQDVDMQPFRRCRDAPYLYAQDAPRLPDLPRNVFLPTKLELHCKPKLSPKRALKEWYNAFQSKLRSKGGTLTMDDPDKSCYATWSNLLQGSKMRFTSVYTCPLTGERFTSGMLRGGEDNYVKDYMVYDSEKKELVSRFKFNGEVADEVRFHKVDIIWYKTKKDAEDAAAARTVDCLLFRYPMLQHIMNRDETSHKYIPMNLQIEAPDDRCRYCEEEAYDVESTPGLWKTISHTVDWVLQFDQSNGDIRFYFVTWARVPDTDNITEEFLRSILDDGGNTFLQEYKGSRGSIQKKFKSDV
eukprot:CCRYP_013621-RA/>CCRYP_013621-RA protein AED:0.37 eAED:0.37 QI:407/1/1/1/1/1/3/65/430